MICVGSREFYYDVVMTIAKTFRPLLYQDGRQVHLQPRTSLASQSTLIWWAREVFSFELWPPSCSVACKLALHPTEVIHQPKTVGMLSARSLSQVSFSRPCQRHHYARIGFQSEAEACSCACRKFVLGRWRRCVPVRSSDSRFPWLACR